MEDSNTKFNMDESQSVECDCVMAQKKALSDISPYHSLGLFKGWNPRTVSSYKFPIFRSKNRLFLKKTSLPGAIFARRCDLMVDPCRLGC